MNCIIVDDEPLARKTIELLINKHGGLNLVGDFNNAISAMEFMNSNQVDLIFLDINMPKVTGLEFARMIPKNALIIFTTAYTEYALESYEIDAIDYLVKPINYPRFEKAVNKAISYHELLKGEQKQNIEAIQEDHLFVKADRKFHKIYFKDILFIEGLKDYVIVQCTDTKLITRLNLKNISEQLPDSSFFRINKSYIVNLSQIESFDNNDVFIKTHTIGIGNMYRDEFFERFLSKNKKRN